MELEENHRVSLVGRKKHRPKGIVIATALELNVKLIYDYSKNHPSTE